MKRLAELLTMSSGAAIGLVTLMVLTLLTMGCCGVRSCPSAACGMKPDKAACAACPVKSAQEATIATPALERLVRSGVKVTVLDARTGKFDDGNRIPGAKALAPDATAAAVAAMIPAKDALVVTYCAGLECPASRMLAEHLKKLGYKNVLEYSAGIAGWREAGNPVETAKEK